MGFRSIGTFSVLVALCSTTAIRGVGLGTDYSDAALRKLSSATQQQRNGQHLANLSALRNLRDPALKPFFYKLAQHNNWIIQVHAVLGLSELSKDGLVDTWLIQQVAPLARQQLVSQSLRDHLLTTQQMQSLLDWSLLEPAPTLLITADLHSKGVSPSEEVLHQLVNNTDLGIATVAALLSANQETIEDVTNRLRRSTAREKRVALSQAMHLIQLYEFPAGKQWLESLLDTTTHNLTDAQFLQSLFTLLHLDHDSGMEQWKNAIPSEPTKLEQVRFLLLLMDAGVEIDDSITQLLNIDPEDGLPYALSRAGSETIDDASQGSSYIQSLIDLVNRGHSKSTQWAFRRASTLPNAFAEEFYTTLTMLPEDSSTTDARRRDVSVLSFSKLIQLDPIKAWQLLRTVEDDSQQQELMLLAMLQHPGDELLEKEATAIRRIGVGRPDAMALLLAARGTEPLSDSDQRLLGLIAASGASIGSPLETQAAWLYLRRVGMTDQALAAATTPSP